MGAHRQATPTKEAIPVKPSLATSAALLLAATGLTACGGSSRPVAATPPITTGSTATPTTATTTTQTSTDPAPPTTTSTAPKATATTSPTTTTPHPPKHLSLAERKRLHRARSVVAKLAPQQSPSDNTVIMLCLHGVGLANPHRINRNLWVVGNPTTPLAITVDGPYVNRQAVHLAGRQLNGVEFTERGGLYLVATVVQSHLQSAIHTVATCLSQRLPGAGQMTF
jgi:hypothetical protein